MTVTTVQPATIINSDVLNLIPWTNDRTDAFGHDPRSTYVEQFWLGTLGPTTTWFLRHCAHHLEGRDAAAVDLREAASTLGIGHQGGGRSAMVKTVARACRFRAARPVGSATLAVRLKLPHLSQRQLQRLPLSVQRRHEDYLAPTRTPTRSASSACGRRTRRGRASSGTPAIPLRRRGRRGPLGLGPASRPIPAGRPRRRVSRRDRRDDRTGRLALK